MANDEKTNGLQKFYSSILNKYLNQKVNNDSVWDSGLTAPIYGI